MLRSLDQNLRARLRAAPPAPPPLWLELGLVVLVTAAFLAAVLALPIGSTPMGDGWMRYLRNVWVLDSGAWNRWLKWRAPGHAWAVHYLIPLTGSLVGAARLVSIASTTALLPLTWAIGRTSVGRWPALLGLLLLAGWADLRVLAIQTTTYSLFGLLVALSALTALHALRRSAWLGLLSGLFMGLAWGTDLRGAGLSIGLALVCALAGLAPDVRRRGPLTGIAVLGVAYAVSQPILQSIPIELYPLTDQVAQQRNFNMQQVRGACFLAKDMFSPPWFRCLLDTTVRNTWRLGVALPAPLALLSGLFVVGVLPTSVRQAWRLLLPVALTAPGVGAALFVPYAHRYAVPLAALLAPAFGLGLWRLARLAGPRAGVALSLAATLALAVGWQRHTDTLLARMEGRANTEQAPRGQGVGVDPEMSRVVEWLETNTDPDDDIMDCVHAELLLRLYPRPAASPSAQGTERACRPYYQEVPTHKTWLLAPEREVRAARRVGWVPVERFSIGGGAWLLVGGGDPPAPSGGTTP